MENPVNAHHSTNLDAFRACVTEYLAGHQDPHHKDMTLLVRQLAPGPNGLPPGIYGFTKTVYWIFCEDIEANILSHLVAVVPLFDLQVFQEPAGADLRARAGSQKFN